MVIRVWHSKKTEPIGELARLNFERLWCASCDFQLVFLSILQIQATTTFTQFTTAIYSVTHSVHRISSPDIFHSAEQLRINSCQRTLQVL